MNDYVTITGGAHSVLTGGDYSVLTWEWWDYGANRKRRTTAYVGEDDIRALVDVANTAYTVARIYGETLCQGNEGREFLDAVDALFEKEADE